MPETMTAAEYRKWTETMQGKLDGKKKPGKKPRHTEDEIQRQIVRAIRKYPHLLCFAVPNGGSRSRTEAAIMVGTGTMAGVADLVVCWDDWRSLPTKSRYTAAVGFLEVKAPKKYQHKAQKEFQARCEELRLPYVVVRSVGEALEALKEWGAI